MLVCAATFSRKQSIFFFNDTATTEIYTLSLHDALPICPRMSVARTPAVGRKVFASQGGIAAGMRRPAAMSAATPIRISSASTAMSMPRRAPPLRWYVLPGTKHMLHRHVRRCPRHQFDLLLWTHGGVPGGLRLLSPSIRLR